MDNRVAEKIDQSFQQVIADIDAIEDPLERARAIQSVYQTVAEKTKLIGNKYSVAILSAKVDSKLSLRRLAQELNISQHRLHLLLNKAKENTSPPVK